MKRDKSIEIRLTSDQKGVIEAAAERSGLSTSAFVLHAALEKAME